MTHELHDRGDARRADAHCEVAFIPRIARDVCVLGHAAIDCPGPRASPRRAIDPRKHDVSSAPRFDRGTAHRRIRRTTLRNRNRAAVRHAFPLIRLTDDPACKPPFDDDRRPRISPRAEPVQTQAPARTRAAQGARIRDRAHRERKGSGDTRALATSTAGCCRLPKTGIARRCATEKEKPRKSENLRGLFRHFWRRRSPHKMPSQHFSGITTESLRALPVNVLYVSTKSKLPKFSSTHIIELQIFWWV